MNLSPENRIAGLLTPLFGGGAMTRLLHPWFSLGFVLCFALQLLNWWRPMAWNADDNRWMRQLGDYVIPADTPVAVGIVALHHREDVYPEPHRFLPERFVGRKPGSYTWIPFGGGIRRCLGAALAMAEQRVVLKAIAARTDLVAPDPAPERARQRNVTMIPSKGGRVMVQHKRAA